MADRMCTVCSTNPVSLQCVCIKRKKTLLCGKCVKKHCEKTGKHDIQPYEVPNSHNVHCKLCTVREAVYMCACHDVATPLCLPCGEKHRMSEFCGRHQFLDIKAYPHFSPGYIANYEARQDRVREALNQLRAVISYMEAAEDKVNTHFEEMMAIVATYRNEKLNELRKLKAEFQQVIERASHEVAEHIYEREYRSADPLVNDIWNFNAQNVSFHSFSLTCDNYSVSQSIRSTVYFHFDISRRNSTLSVIPIVSQHTIQNWDTRLKTWTTPTALSRPIEVNRDCAWVLTEQGQVALCGGQQVRNDYLKCACLIDVNTGQVAELPSMMKARSWHALVYIDNTLCVFGGVNGLSLKSCEMFRLGSQQWEALGNMNQSRYGCTACLCNSSIYLSGGCSTAPAERFDWKSRTFTTLPLAVDEQLISTCFVMNDELITVDPYHSFIIDISLLLSTPSDADNSMRGKLQWN